MAAKFSKPTLGDCSINRRLTNTKRMTNQMLLTFGNYLSLSIYDLLTPRDGLFSAPRMVSRPAQLDTHVVSISQFEAQLSCIRHVI